MIIYILMKYSFELIDNEDIKTSINNINKKIKYLLIDERIFSFAEIRDRQREMDIIVNKLSKNKLKIRPAIVIELQ